MYIFLQNEEAAVSWEQITELLHAHMDGHSWHKVLLIPPDITRLHSGAGSITAFYYSELTKRGCAVKVLPALGTHVPMTPEELHRMFGEVIPLDAYLTHDFQSSIMEIGTIPTPVMEQLSEGLFHSEVSVSINRELLEPDYDAILSIGQVIPHEIAGMSNYTKNIVVGCGGGEIINVSHFLGVFYGLDRLLGVDHNPVRDLFDYVQEHLLARLPLIFVQTVMVQLGGADLCKGIFIGEGRGPYESAVSLSQRVNFNLVEYPISKCVVWMDPSSYHSTWVTNKAIYRTELAMAPGGELIIIAPGVHLFGENELADSIIRKYGYLSRKEALSLCQTEPVLQHNLSITGHLIHGCPDGLQITYCTDGLSREEVESVHFRYMSVEDALRLYPCQNWNNGWHTSSSGEKLYFISNAALGMWRCDTKL